MTTSRYSSLSVVTRQWVVDTYAPLIGGSTDKHRRVTAFMDDLLQAFRNGELAAVEYLEAILGPAVAALDAEMVAKFAASDAGDQDQHGQDVTIPGQTGGGPTLGPPPQQGPLAPPRGPTSSPGSGFVAGQGSFLPTDLIHARRVEVARRIEAVRTEAKRLRASERESREFRTNILNPELEALTKQLAALDRAAEVLRDTPVAGIEALAVLGIGAQDLGLTETELSQLLQGA